MVVGFLAFGVAQTGPPFSPNCLRSGAHETIQKKEAAAAANGPWQGRWD
jgi:hypothetical protein